MGDFLGIRRRSADIGRLLLIALLAGAALAAVALASPRAADSPPAPARNASDTDPDGLLVLAVLSAERVMVADPRTGATRQRRVPGGTFCHGPLHVIGDRVVLSAERDRRPIALSLPLTLTGPGRSLGPAETFTASGTPDRAWISHWERSRVWRADERVLGSLREVDAEGRVVARTTLRMPAWGSLEAVVDGAFLLSHEGRISLRRPGAATRAVRDDWVVAAGTSRIASCRGDCRRLRIWVAWSGGRPLRLPIETGGTVMSIAPTPLRPAAFPSARAR